MPEDRQSSLDQPTVSIGPEHEFFQREDEEAAIDGVEGCGEDAVVDVETDEVKLVDPVFRQKVRNAARSVPLGTERTVLSTSRSGFVAALASVAIAAPPPAWVRPGVEPPCRQNIALSDAKQVASR